MPGLGQTKISKGKPYWLTGVAAYGALAGGFIVHQSYLKTYDSYRVEEDPLKRKDLFDKTQKQMNISRCIDCLRCGLMGCKYLLGSRNPK